jgi:hypothetical protein
LARDRSRGQPPKPERLNLLDEVTNALPLVTVTPQLRREALEGDLQEQAVRVSILPRRHQFSLGRDEHLTEVLDRDVAKIPKIWLGTSAVISFHRRAPHFI